MSRTKPAHTCWVCKAVKPLSEFTGPTGKACSACRAGAEERKRLRMQAYYQANKDKYERRKRDWRRINQTEYKRRSRLAYRARKVERKRQVLAYYGSRCACCGETEPLFLTIDHINGGGNAHRKAIGSQDQWYWLWKQGYPEGFQILCCNCNFGRARNGGRCPHERVHEAADAVAEQHHGL